MSIPTDYRRMIIKRSSIPTVEPTIPSVEPQNIDDFNNLLSTDLLAGEFFANIEDNKLWFRTLNGILPIPFGADLTNFATNDLIFTGNRLHDTDGFNLTVSTDGATLAQTNLRLTNSLARLGFNNNYIAMNTENVFIYHSNVSVFRVFSNEIVINDNGNDFNFRVEGNTLPNLFNLDGGLDFIGINVAVPTERLDINGNLKVTGNIINIGKTTVDTINLKSIPSYADDTAAGAGGLVAGDVYQTDGTGSAPLNVAGIVMRKQ
jgi:hypothetical protein